MIKGAIIGGAETVTFVEGVPNNVRAALKKEIEKLTLKLLRTVKQDKLSGQVLNVRTGRLRRSINSEISETSDSIIGSVGTNVEYAKYHEYGEIQGTGGRGILDALKKAALPQSVNGLPPRSFLRSALYEAREDIQNGIKTAVKEGAKFKR
jgi:phage gpG-like protein